MAERGGPTTQAGIHYQNSVSALYLGRLCDAAPRPERARVVEVPGALVLGGAAVLLVGVAGAVWGEGAGFGTVRNPDDVPNRQD